MNEREDLSDDGASDEEDQKTAEELAKTVKKAEIDKGAMSVAEMQQIIASQKREIKNLQDRCRQQEEEKLQIIENFKSSTQMLIERIKDLESSGGGMELERPQTAIVLDKICK